MGLFIEAYNKTLKHEGLYVNDVDDRGGETYKGIARNFHESWAGWVIIDNNKSLPNFPDNLKNNNSLDDLVQSFYKEVFWDKLKCDLIQSQIIAEKLFDIAVNQGIKTASKYLQESLNCLNNNSKNLTVDGIIGKATISKLSDFMKKRNFNQNEEVLLKCLQGLQFKRYYDIVCKNTIQKKYFYGWVRRI